MIVALCLYSQIRKLKSEEGSNRSIILEMMKARVHLIRRLCAMRMARAVGEKTLCDYSTFLVLVIIDLWFSRFQVKCFTIGYTAEPPLWTFSLIL